MSTKKQNQARTAARWAAALNPVAVPPWTPFERGALPPIDRKAVADQAARLGRPIEEVLEVYRAIERETIVINSRYQVNIRELPTDGGVMHHLSIKRLDKAAVHDWRDLQRIKNELCGPEREAVEIFPAESRLVDSANQYHLWVLPEGARVPFGFDQRLVTETPGGNAVQRPFDPT